MTRMRTPEIEVVRFNEADVIVASGERLSVNGANDTAPGNLVLNLGGYTFKNSAGNTISTFYENLNGIYGAGAVSGSTSLSDTATGKSPTIDDVLSRDRNGEAMGGVDGNYTWVPIGTTGNNVGYFVKQ